MYGSPEVTTGGRALKFYSSMRIDVRKVEAIKLSANEIIGNRTRAKIVKNKLAPPFKQAEFDIMYGKGISKTGEILDMAVEYDIIKKSGSWFSYGEERLGQGRDKVKDIIEGNPELAAELEKKIKAKMEELQESGEQKYQGKAIPKADSESEGEETASQESSVKQTREAARAKLDIAVEDDDF